MPPLPRITRLGRMIVPYGIPRHPLAPSNNITSSGIFARHASGSSNSTSRQLLNVVYSSGLVVIVALGYFYITDTRASIHRYVVPPLLQVIYPDAEDSHHAGTAMLKELYSLGLNPRERGHTHADDGLGIYVFGQRLSNPVGISGGLDKQAELPDALFALGAGVVEIGGVTPMPQDGNASPRVFRLPSQQALINRYGLNSDGADMVAMRLRQRVREYAYNHGFGIDDDAERFVLDGGADVPPGSLLPGRLLAVQVAKNKATPEHDMDAVVRDYTYCVQRLGRYADVIVVNVSSPNTPGLRSLQSRDPLTKLLSAVVASAQAVSRKTKPAVMVKVSPDEDSNDEIQGICDAVWAAGVDGVIVGNTTKRRPEPRPKGFLLPPKEAMALREQGGYSGPLLMEQTLSLIKRYRRMLDQGHSISTESEASDSEQQTNPAQRAPTDPKVIFASGGITSGPQATEVLNAGASVAMVYTAMIYGGVGTVARLKDEMRSQLKQK